jgi:eukaryotic translation initiation factor 2C
VQPNFNPTITLTVVGKDHKFVLSPEVPVVEGGQPSRNPNCLPGSVIDTVVTSHVEWDFYLCSHQEILDTSKPAHYNVLLEENNFTCVHRFPLHSFFAEFSCGPQDRWNIIALCHVYARCTCTISEPAPVYCKHQAFSPSLLCIPDISPRYI